MRNSKLGTHLGLGLAAWAAAGGVLAEPVHAELAGNSLPAYPSFHFVRAFNSNGPVEVGVDTTRFPTLVGKTADVYVAAAKATWSLGDALADAGLGAETRTFVSGGYVGNTFQVAGAGELSANAGEGLGVAYDVIIDVNRNGLLDNGDLIDGGAGEAGFYVVHDTTTAGPLATTPLEVTVTGVTSGFSRERIWYPSDIANMGALPLVVISHGNGHQYNWYDYLQNHLASYGYIVMSHQNNTVPGIETASTTTLQHTDAIIGQQATLGGGVLNGHIDTSRIVWIGHSRGGEGVARAYDRIFDTTWVPTNYTLDNLRLVSSIAPTDFLGPNSSNPHGVNYHFIYGAADGDVSGDPSNDIAQAFHIYERASGFRQSTYVHGADHNDFNCCGFEDFAGPPGTAIGRPEAQQVAKGVYLAVVKHYVEGNVPSKDYLWRPYAQLKPMGVAATTTVVSEYKEGPDSGKFVIDDYQTQTSKTLSSSGGAVQVKVTDFAEGLLNDTNTDFTWTTTDRFNGMTRAMTNDTTRGAVFSVVADDGKTGSIIWNLPTGTFDLTPYKYLSFRACQGTRHPLTTAQLKNYTWQVTLVDGQGVKSVIDFSAYAAGIQEPYQRTGSGTGAGWQNEFGTVRIRLADFLAALNGRPSRLNLADVRQVRFDFPDASGPARLGLDDLELTKD